MSDQATSEKPNGGQAVGRVVGLLLLLGLVIYAAPRLNKYVSDQKREGQAAEEQGGERLKKDQTRPKQHAEWIPLIEKQLPVDEGYRCEVVHVRLSGDRQKLLIDLQVHKGEEVSRFDLILERDEFGRYVSAHKAVPMKLYLPGMDKEVSEADVIAPDQK